MSVKQNLFLKHHEHIATTTYRLQQFVCLGEILGFLGIVQVQTTGNQKKSTDFLWLYHLFFTSCGA